MRHLWLFCLAASASLEFCGAAAAEPTVILGIGPGNVPLSNPQPFPPPSARSGNYGGGFLEFLITGHDPTPRGVRAILPPALPQATAPMAAPPPAVRQASYSAPPPISAGLRSVNPVFVKQEVDYGGPESAGTIVVDTQRKFLFLVLGNGRALRYGIGVGREGFEWHGEQTISRKAEWPGWTPPAEMLQRQPYLARHMDGGPENPLGARALYLGDSLYRIHGTNQPETIGLNVSSGCIRMMNGDVIDLYGRVKVGTKVVVM